MFKRKLVALMGINLRELRIRMIFGMPPYGQTCLQNNNEVMNVVGDNMENLIENQLVAAIG
jgi:hypothetical protein